MAPQFETLGLAQLEQVSGAGRIGRKIRHKLRDFFEGKTISGSAGIDPSFVPTGEVGIEIGED